MPHLFRKDVKFLFLIVDLNALAWLEDYLQTWPGTLLVVYAIINLTSLLKLTCYFRSHDRAFLCVNLMCTKGWS